jgi:hypothetical protein
MIIRQDIKVPDFNDSYVKFNSEIDKKVFYLRFTWNETSKRWLFGIYTDERKPIVQMVKIVPQFPLLFNHIDERLPSGTFGVYTALKSVGRQDFKENKAIFAYCYEDTTDEQTI